ncbi:hypothetical protein IU484_26860 [Nocardia farcinica]|nr:hypothetical protein [Nocardia farcinica]
MTSSIIFREGAPSRDPQVLIIALIIDTGSAALNGLFDTLGAALHGLVDTLWTGSFGG